MKASEIKNKTIKVKVTPNNMTYPRSGFKSGDFAIIKFRVDQVIEGEIPDECCASIVFGDSNENAHREYIICVKGNFPSISFISQYILTGELVIDKTWGPQYNLTAIRLDYNLQDANEQKKFFSFFMTENQVNALFESVENPISLLENKDIGELCKVKGIGPSIAQKLCERYEGCKDNSTAYIGLKDLGLTKNAIDKLVKFYGSPDIVISKIDANPYILATEVSGYGWLKTDAIAMKKGFAKDCRFRVEAYTKYFLEQQADQAGNSWVKINDLLSAVATECYPVTNENLNQWLKEIMIGPKDFEKYYAKMLAGEEVKPLNEMPLLFYDPEQQKVGLFSLRFMEKEIARHLKRIKSAPCVRSFSQSTIEMCIEEAENQQGFKYTDEQKQTIFNIVNNNVSILTGSAGTGKTTTLTAVVKVFKRYGLQIQQCALSGRAASKLKEVTKIDGKTIHRTLCYIPDKESFKYNERCKMPHDVIILDETSMVGGDIFLSLIQAIRDGAKLIMVGDIKQLEAIGLANVLKDCMGSAYIPTSMLSKIHRQAAASGIITQSINMSNGMQMCKNDFVGEEIRGELKDFKLVASYKPEAVSYNIIREFRRLYNEQHIPADQIQVIVPMRVRGNISCNNLNSQIQEIVNPGVHPRQVFQQYTENGTTYQVCYKPGDRIIVVKNNYHAKTPEGKEVAIFNGNLGVIKDIYNNSMIVEVDGVDKVVLSKDEWYDINLAYAITCHKLQGSQAPYCIVGLNTSCYALYSKEWLYTAVTRATKFCALVVQTSSLNQAVRISHVKTKQTWLCKDLVEFYLAEHAGEGFN